MSREKLTISCTESEQVCGALNFMKQGIEVVSRLPYFVGLIPNPATTYEQRERDQGIRKFEAGVEIVLNSNGKADGLLYQVEHFAHSALPEQKFRFMQRVATFCCNPGSETQGISLAAMKSAFNLAMLPTSITQQTRDYLLILTEDPRANQDLLKSATVAWLYDLYASAEFFRADTTPGLVWTFMRTGKNGDWSLSKRTWEQVRKLTALTLIGGKDKFHGQAGWRYLEQMFRLMPLD